jgi:HK97 family phage portal protein
MFRHLANLFKSTRNATPKPGIISVARPTPQLRSYSQNAQFYNNSAVYSCVNLISSSVASLNFIPKHRSCAVTNNQESSCLERLLRQPNPCQSQTHFIKQLVSSYLLEGNAYILGTFNPGDTLPRQLNVLKPNRMQIIPGEYGIPQGYIYTVGDRSEKIDFTEEVVTPGGQTRHISRILHLKTFNPANNSHGDFYGHSPLEAAREPIICMNLFDQRNTQSLATPRGPSAMISSTNPLISEHEQAEVVHRITSVLSQEGAVFFLKNGYNIQFLEDPTTKHQGSYDESTIGPARRIAQVFGVPHELIGLAESRDLNQSNKFQQFWYQCVIPLAKEIALALDNWLCPAFDYRLSINYSQEDIPKFR